MATEILKIRRKAPTTPLKAKRVKLIPQQDRFTPSIFGAMNKFCEERGTTPQELVRLSVAVFLRKEGFIN